MIKTSQDILRRAYTLLRRPSQAKLPYQDMLDTLHNIVLGLIQDNQLSPRQQRTAVAAIRLQEDSNGDFTIDLEGDFEESALEYGATSSSGTNWYPATIYSMEAWRQHVGDPGVVAAFYGSEDLESGRHVKINRSPGWAGNMLWRLTYRESLLSVLQLDTRPPLPTNFSPLLEYDLALEGMTLCIDTSPEWKEFVSTERAFLIAKSTDWHRRYQKHLDSSVGPQVQTARRLDSRRGGGRSNSTRGHLPLR